jgi:DNA-binding SARP family transcriptional activator/tetratricopeptide (TPR) repeat protein
VAVQFQVLGPVDATRAGRRVPLGHARQRAVLATLLVEANRTVTADQLIDRVWGDSSPQRSRAVLYSYLSRLRTALEIPIRREFGGYVLTIDEASVDMHLFRLLARRARATAEDDRALTLFDQALGLWRDEPFKDVDTAWFASVRRALEAERQAVELDRVDLALSCGRHAELVNELGSHVQRRPLDERAAGQFMLACYRSGRQADALRHYHWVREQLADQLGVDPNPALQQLYHQILVADAGLELHSPYQRTLVRPPAPRQLPAPLPAFTGRKRDLELLAPGASAAAPSIDGPTITLITGTGGMGKTWLAVQWAHENLDQFPDGQLFVDLQGFAPAGQPLGATAVIRGFLDALGVEPTRVPPDPHAQAALYRDLLADRRILVVLDNAADMGQVGPVLPTSRTCTVLITSRHQLTSLTTRYGAHHIRLGTLLGDDARNLLDKRLGIDRTRAEPGATAELIAYCHGSPLALSVMAGRAQIDPEISLSALADQLRDATERLTELDDEDPAASVPAVLSWSVKSLSMEQAGVFDLLGIAPGPDIGLDAAASLAGIPAARARRVLRSLEQASLLERSASGRYRMHDLVRLYARRRAHRLGRVVQDFALRRIITFYLDVARAGDQRLAPYDELCRESASPTSSEAPIELPDESAALRWFDAEYSCLRAAQQVAVAENWYDFVVGLSWALRTYHVRRGYLDEDVTSLRAGLVAADHLPDPAMRAAVRWRLGRTLTRADRCDDAAELLREALAIATESRDGFQRAQTHYVYAWTCQRQGHDRLALIHAEQALALYRKSDRPVWTARALGAVGWYCARLGEYERGESCCQAALASLETMDLSAAAEAMDSLGYINYRLGRNRQALSYYHRALGQRRAIGNKYHVADTLEAMGDPYVALGQCELAKKMWQEALALYAEQGRETDARRIQLRLA